MEEKYSRHKWHNLQSKIDEKEKREGRNPIDFGFGKCYDDLVRQSQVKKVPKNISFFKPDQLESKESQQ